MLSTGEGPCSHLPFFVSGTFDLFNATCEQYHKNVFNPFLNGEKTVRNGKCEQGFISWIQSFTERMVVVTRVYFM